MRLRPISEQVIVITGATSGIGLATVRQAADAGARLVLAARNADALDALGSELKKRGTQVLTMPCDVARRDEVDRLATAAVVAFGRIDSWINDAAVALYGELVHAPVEDQRQLFEVNYWGVVYGSLAAVRHMRRGGGALINVGSILSDIPVPLQGAYVAAKHAVKGFTNTLRIELASAGVPVSVTLIKPSSIDTPYVEHARTPFAWSPITPPPRYVPEVVARAILYACEHPVREVYVGGTGRLIVALGRMFAPLYDALAGAWLYRAQQSSRSSLLDADRRDNLYGPKADGAVRGRTTTLPARRSSLYMEAQLRPWIPLAAGAAAIALIASWGRTRRTPPSQW